MSIASGVRTIRTVPEAVSRDEDNATRGTIVFFRDVQSIHAVAPDDPRSAEMLAIVQEALDTAAAVDVTLDTPRSRIVDIRHVSP